MTKEDLQQIAELLAPINQRLDGIDKRLDGMDKRLDGMDKRLDVVDKRLDGMDKRLDGVDKRLDTLEESNRRNGILLEELNSKVQLAYEGISSNAETLRRLPVLELKVNNLSDQVFALQAAHMLNMSKK